VRSSSSALNQLLGPALHLLHDTGQSQSLARFESAEDIFFPRPHERPDFLVERAPGSRQLRDLAARAINKVNHRAVERSPVRLALPRDQPGALTSSKSGVLMFDNAARERVPAIRWVFERHRRNLSAIYFIAQKD
jgi:hypothetical protein